jgi:hypothetical protein
MIRKPQEVVSECRAGLNAVVVRIVTLRGTNVSIIIKNMTAIHAFFVSESGVCTFCFPICICPLITT